MYTLTVKEYITIESDFNLLINIHREYQAHLLSVFHAVACFVYTRLILKNYGNNHFNLKTVDASRAKLRRTFVYYMNANYLIKKSFFLTFCFVCFL